MPARSDSAGESDAPSQFSAAERPQSTDSYSEYPHVYGTPEPGILNNENPTVANPGREAPVPVLHAVLIATILLAGLAVGIGRSWWIDERLEAASAKRTSLAATPPRALAQDPAHPSLQSSIDRAYIPPMPHSEDEKNAGVKPAAPAPSAAASVLASRPSSSAPTRVPEDSLDQEQANAATTLPASGNAEPEKPSDARNDLPERRLEKPGKTNRKAASRKLASSATQGRNREIDRVRGQAFSETSKDRTGGAKPAAAPSTVGPQSERRSAYQSSRIAQRTVTSAQYARCERISHIIRREQCKWKLCNNKWGKGACPSFSNERPFVS